MKQDNSEPKQFYYLSKVIQRKGDKKEKKNKVEYFACDDSLGEKEKKKKKKEKKLDRTSNSDLEAYLVMLEATAITRWENSEATALLRFESSPIMFWLCEWT